MRDWHLRKWLQGWAVALALGAVGVSPALAQTIVTPVPNQLANGQTVDAPQLMANFNSIINQVNAGAAHRGINSDITALTALTSVAASGAVSGGSLAITGAGSIGTNLTVTGTLGAGTLGAGATTVSSLTDSGNAVVTGTLGVTGATTLTGLLTANGGLATTGAISTTGNISTSAGQILGTGVVTTSNNALGGITYHGGATSDGYYSTLNGSILTAFGAGVRATNTASARFSLASGTFNASFNTASATRTGTGVWAIVFTQALNSNAYQVTGNCVPNAGGVAEVCPAATAKTTTGFTLNFLGATTGAVADLGATYTSDIIVTGGN